ncbi:hypothetical protein [Bradyrhizobium sp. S3.9.1]|uniref:hypothetical protein n=1 Tax=Bradyrhizobium sp. S3.9.1 TaxID=3156431 RepID=UPI003395F311
MSTPIRDGAGPTMPFDAPITEARIRQALLAVAYVISEHGRTEYGPLMERLEQELAMYREARDPLSRARAILQAYGATQEQAEAETT